MPRSGIYKCLNNSELAYYFAGRVACQPLFFRHSAWGQYGGDAYATAEGVEPIPTGRGPASKELSRHNEFLPSASTASGRKYSAGFRWK